LARSGAVSIERNIRRVSDLPWVGTAFRLGSRSGKQPAMQGEALNKNNFRIDELICLRFSLL
jgi:hypothetical protein